ncbi:MAG: CRISPR-associated protein Csx15 [Chloroflexota bacterium]|nr:CRISPR-associated protein Csx15 [Chloroflexota bacterium]
MLTIINFSHPLTAEQRGQIEVLAGETIERVIDVPTRFDDRQPFLGQVEELVGRSGLSGEEWQSLPIVVNPPSYGPIVAVLLAYIHGLCGHFPTVVRLRPMPETNVPRFEVAELVRLDQTRRSARAGRDGRR